MTERGYESVACKLPPVDWRAELRGVTIFLAIMFGPGVAAYLAFAVIVAWPGGAVLFPEMAPEHVPMAWAVDVEKWYLTAGGLVLVGLAVWDGVLAWWKGKDV